VIFGLRSGKSGGPDRAKRPKKDGKPRAPEVIASAAPLAEGEYEFSPNLVVLSAPHSKQDIALRECADAMISRHVEAGRRGLVLCAAALGSGVSFTAANLAVALAEAGVTTLLVDANLRAPSLPAYIRPAAVPLGLARHLREGEGQFSDLIHENVLPGLSLTYAGDPSPDSQELLTGERFHAFIRRAMREFTCTLVDTAPANRYADARVAAAVVGYAMIVARRSTSYIDDVAQLSHELAQDGAMVVGSILNGT
jgi:receptor protein-tyrosine kinase